MILPAVTKVPGAESLSTREPQAADDDYAVLLRRLQRGQRDALETLLLRAQEIAYRFSLNVCGSAADAEDAMQEALVKTYRHAASIREPRAFRTWLYRTVKNACLIGRRRPAGHPGHLLSLDELGPAHGRGAVPEPADTSPPADEVVMTDLVRRRVRRALAALPPNYRLMIFLRDMEGLSTREAAEVAGLSEANVKVRLHRARLMLRKALEERA
jgi:RNA polymerase sigma-70 factor (ECF subfamily)